MPASRLNFSAPKCVPVPMPAEPNFSSPGFLFAALELLCTLAVMLQGSADYPAKPVRIIEPFGAVQVDMIDHLRDYHVTAVRTGDLEEL